MADTKDVVEPTVDDSASKVVDSPKKKASPPTLKWVVDHSMLGTMNAKTTHNYVRGEVVTEADLGEAFARYRKIGAIRPYVKIDEVEAEVEEAPPEE